MGVLVQELVPAVAAGVAFSRDPVTAERKILIESSLGLGEPVVDGEVTPDAHELTHELRLTSRRLGRKRIRLGFTDAVAVSEVAAADSIRFAITDDQASEVGQLALAAEATLGLAIDIEWAIDPSGRLWLLQARPITTLPTDGTAP